MIKIRAPGKIILIGEHAVVHGSPALVTTVDLYIECEISSHNDSDLQFKDRTFGTLTSTWENSLAARKKAKVIHREFEKTNDKETLKYWLREPMKVFELIVGVFNAMLGQKRSVDGFSISTSSTVPIGGFGSSSAFVVAVLRALCDFFKCNWTKKDLFEAAVEVETLIHGRVSGADQAAVVYGGMTEFNKLSKPQVMSLNLPGNLLDHVLIIDSGKPESSTGEVVAMVSDRISSESKLMKSVFASIEAHTGNIKRALKERNRDLLYSSINEAGLELVKMGIVTQDTQELIHEIHNLGGFAKVSGAGSIEGKGSGAVICLADDYTNIIELIRRRGMKYYPLALSVPGVHIV